tara:strand:+ start:120 stop:746 length:627 start_codon:yes stop_codon:yes gene_type:complete
MKKLLFIILILFAGNATASSLPNCPSKPSVIWDNCYGTIIFPKDSEWAGDKYVGEWKDNIIHGQGVYTWVEGDIYDGEWKDAKQHGQGTQIWADGEKYVGEFKDDKRHGQGTYTYVNGDTYVGEYKDDKRNGQGTYTYASGDTYAGEWKDSEQHGKGTYTYASGTKESGYHMNGDYVPRICENMGLTKDTESFGQCVVSLINEINEDD